MIIGNSDCRQSLSRIPITFTKHSLTLLRSISANRLMATAKGITLWDPDCEDELWGDALQAEQ